MDIKNYRVVYRPFPESTMTNEWVMTGTDVKDVYTRFEKSYPAWNIVSVTEE